MKKLLVLTLLLFVSIAINAQEEWIRFKDYPTDLIFNLEEESEIEDTPFVFINREDKASSYVIPVKLITSANNNIKNMEVSFRSIAASYDRKDRLVIYLRGKIDMSCCYPAPIALEFFDKNGKLIQIARTDINGNFKVKSINGNMAEISKGRIKFNFSKMSSFDGNADTRATYLSIYKKPIDKQFETASKATVLGPVTGVGK